MLAQEQAVDIVQRHIERVFRGGGHLVVSAAVIALLAVLHRVFPVDLLDHAVPDLRLIRAGAHGHRHALCQHTAVELVDAALHPVAAHIHDGDEGVRSAAAHIAAHNAAGKIGVVVLDTHHPAGDGGGDIRMLHGGLHGGDLTLLEGQVILRLAYVRVPGVDLQRVTQLLAGGGGFLLCFQLGDLAFRGGDGVFQPLLIDHEPVEGKLQGLGVVGKQDVTLLHRIALRHQDLQHGLVRVLFHVRRPAGDDLAGKTVGQADISRAGDGRHRFHKGGLAAHRGAAGKKPEGQNTQDQNR